MSKGYFEFQQKYSLSCKIHSHINIKVSIFHHKKLFECARRPIYGKYGQLKEKEEGEIDSWALFA
jgi:hypothetical protein